MQYKFNLVSVFRKGKMSRMFILLMALYLFNISIDFSDPRTAHFKEDLSINEIESFVELILEEVADFENAFEEQAESDREHGTVSHALLFIPVKDFEIPHTVLFYQISYTSLYPISAYSATLDIFTPPPKYT